MLEKMKNTSSAVVLNYFLRIPNVGDRINPHIMSSIINVDPICRDPAFVPHLLACGSLIKRSTKLSRIWGSGLMKANDEFQDLEPSHIHALRGKLTVQALRDRGYPIPDVPLGDPGYLAAGLLRSPPKEKKYLIGLVPHYVDRGHPWVEQSLKHAEVLDLNVHLDPLRFLENMSLCEIVISSSLHGLIFAEALGIPNLWIKLSENISGGNFKYKDWFSLTNMPEKVPSLPRVDIMELSKRAIMHDCQISTAELIQSFPRNDTEIFRAEYAPQKSWLVCRRSPIPIFIISFNRGQYLKKCIASYRLLKCDIDIIIHDFGSDDPETLQILDQFEKEGISVIRDNKIFNPGDLNFVNRSVQNYFANFAEHTRYVVTDCDVDFGDTDPDALNVYNAMLDALPKAPCVGPMLRIDDIPTDYPLYEKVINRHIEQFWGNEPEWIKLNGKSYAFQSCSIDTTFALHRANEPFRRKKKALRVYLPFEARHLDWYLSPDQFSRSNYATTLSKSISHWSNAELLDDSVNEVLRYSNMICVRSDELGQLFRQVVAIRTPKMKAADANDISGSTTSQGKPSTAG